MGNAEHPQRIAEEFLQWRFNASAHRDFLKRFGAGFSYRMDVGGISDEDVIWLFEHGLPWQEVVLESETLVDDAVTLVACGTDPVTMLRYRLTWRIAVRDEQVWSVEERGEIL